MKLVVGVDCGRELVRALMSAERRVWIVCPFISCCVAEELLPRVEDGKVLTSLNSEIMTCINVVESRGYIVKFLENLHAKLYVIDDCAYIGSVNLTESGLRRNYEVILMVCKGEELFDDLVRAFEALWSIS